MDPIKQITNITTGSNSTKTHYNLEIPLLKLSFADLKCMLEYLNIKTENQEIVDKKNEIEQEMNRRLRL